MNNNYFLIMLMMIVIICALSKYNVKDTFLCFDFGCKSELENNDFDDEDHTPCDTKPEVDVVINEYDTDGELPDKCIIKRDTDYNGYTFLTKNVKDHIECCDYCLQYPNQCQAWTFNKQTEQCKLKYKVPAASCCKLSVSGTPKLNMTPSKQTTSSSSSNVTPSKKAPNRMGCFKDDSTHFLSHSVDMPDITPDKCIDYCRNKNYRYAGLQQGNKCYCDNRPFRGFGEKTADSECDTPCGGDKNQKCGAVLRQDIYDIDPDKIEEPTRLGCYKDDNARFLKGLPAPHYIKIPELTPEKCFEHCKQNNFRYAGVQAGYACLCDNQPVRGFGEKMPDSECNMPCTGDGSKKCGSYWRQDIYDLQSD